MRAVTDSTGTVTGSCTYGAWGNATSTSGTMTTPFGFAGGYRDVASGLYYFRARWYNPVTGQWMSLDPSVGTTMAPYDYAGNDPVGSVDLTGLYSMAAYWLAVTEQWIGTQGAADAAEAQPKAASAAAVAVNVAAQVATADVYATAYAAQHGDTAALDPVALE